MKKIIYLILGVLLFIPIFVSAGKPKVLVTPKSTNGANIYDYSDSTKIIKTLKYGETYTIQSESMNSKHSFGIYDEKGTRIGESILSEWVLKDSTFKLNEKDLSKAYSGIVVVEQEIRKGPSMLYEGTGVKLEKGTNVKIKYLEANKKSERLLIQDRTSNWAYIEYNGTKGYVFVERMIALGQTRYTTLIAPTSGKRIFDNISNAYYDSNPIALIKQNVHFNAKVTTLEIDSDYDGLYIEYGNIQGLTYGLAFDYNLIFIRRQAIKFTTQKEIKVYENLDGYNRYDTDNPSLTSNVVTVLPANTVFESNYYEEFNNVIIVYYEKDDVKGWIYEHYSDALYFNDCIGGSPIIIADEKYIGADSAIEEFAVPVKKNNTKNTTNNTDRVINTNTKGGSLTSMPKIVYISLAAVLLIVLTAVITASIAKKKRKDM
jgi:hypothetical protein